MSGLRTLTQIFTAAALAAAVLRPATAADEKAASPALEEIRVIHYNLKNWLSMERRINGEFQASAPKPEDEKKAVVTILAAAHPDVLGVCEIGPESDLIDLQTRLKTAGLDLPHRRVLQAADPVRHVAVLSRFPIEADHSQKDLSYELDNKKMSFNRGILDVTLRITPDYQLRLLQNHLKSRRDVAEGDQALMRRHEAELLRKYIDTLLAADPDMNLLVTGDFNDTRDEQPIKLIQGSFGTEKYLRDIPAPDELGYRWTYCWAFADKYERIDFAFGSPALFPEIILDECRTLSHADWFKASDHRPVMVTLRPVDKRFKRK